MGFCDIGISRTEMAGAGVRSRQRSSYGPCVTLVAALVMCLAGQSSAVPYVHVNVGGAGPDGTISAPGGTIAVEVLASDIPAGSDGLGMFGMGFTILFDDAGLTAADGVLGPLWYLTGFDDSRNDPGNVGLTSNRFFQESGPSGDDILLGTIEFTAEQVGTWALTLDYFTDVGDNILFDMTILDDDPGAFFTSGSISIIPEPASFALVLAGFAGLCGWRRFHRGMENTA
jgi:hypothetical protein